MGKKDPSEELRQRGLSKDRPTLKIQNLYFYNLGATTLKCLQDNGIINVNLGTFGNKKPDQIVVDPDSRSIVAYIEYKKAKEFDTDAKKMGAFNEQIFVVKQIKCPLYIITDGTTTEWLNAFQSTPGADEKDRKNGNRVLIQDELGNPITRPFNPIQIKDSKKKNIEFKKLYNLISSILRTVSSTANRLIPASKLDPTDLSRSVWQSIYAATGAKPEECLYTFVEIFVYKYLSDLGIIRGTYSFEYLLGMYDVNGTRPIDVLKYYMDTVREHMKQLFPAGADGTTIINGSVFHVGLDANGRLTTSNGDENTFKDILDAFDRYEADHGKFVDIDKDFKTKLFESFLKNDNDVRKKSGQFFTPLKVVQPIVDMAEVRPSMSICDPACGVGKFLLEAIADKIDTYFSFDDNGILQSKVSLYGFEKEDTSGKDNRVIILAKANFLIYFAKFLAQNPDSAHCKEIANMFNRIFTLKKGAGGTLEHLEENKYDLILTNPPYLVNGSGKLKSNMSNTEDYEWNGLGLESLFMEWIVKSLKTDGFAYVVIPDGMLSNMQNATLKRQLKSMCYIRGLISLPLNAFFATSKKTYIIVLQKKEKSQDTGIYPAQTDPVFTYLCSSIGETLDVNRFPDPDHNDLEKATRLYKIFRAGQFSGKLFGKDDTADKRMKLLPISVFAPDSTWIIEKQWSNAEKEDLGIKEKQNVASIDEFCDMLADLKDSISNIIGDLTILEASNGQK